MCDKIYPAWFSDFSPVKQEVMELADAYSQLAQSDISNSPSECAIARLAHVRDFIDNANSITSRLETNFEWETGEKARRL
jgi:hypothetical protein